MTTPASPPAGAPNDSELGMEAGARTWSPADQTALLGVILAAALAVFVVPGSWDWLNFALGITLLVVLHAFERDPDTSWLHLLAFGLVAGMCWVLATGVFAELLFAQLGRSLPPPEYVWVELAGERHVSVSTDPISRLKDYETALIWSLFSLLEAIWAGVRRGKWPAGAQWLRKQRNRA